MRVRHEDADLPDIDVPIRQVQIHPHRARQPPNDRTGAGPRVQVMDVPEADAFIALVVEDHNRLDCAVLQDFDLRKSLRLGLARGHLDVRSHLCVEDDRRGLLARGAGELRHVRSGDGLIRRCGAGASGDSEGYHDLAHVTHRPSSVGWYYLESIETTASTTSSSGGS